MKTTILLLAGLLLVLMVGEAHSVSPSVISDLKGLREFYVVVENLDNPQWESEGVTRAKLQTHIEARLRQAGIKVLTPVTRDSAYLYLMVTSLRVSPDLSLYAVSFTFELQEKVILARNEHHSLFAPTWEKRMISIASPGGRRSIQDRVDDLVDIFINDYLAANPK